MATQHHTPGPWRTRDIGVNGSVTVYTMRNDVAMCMDRAPMAKGEAAANARLIAAAPDMLAVLVKLAGYVEANPRFMSADDASLVRAAIAKATGTDA